MNCVSEEYFNYFFFSIVIEYWKALALDTDLCGLVIDNFLSTLVTSCVHDSGENGDRQHTASVQPFTIHCALHEIVSVKELKSVRLSNWVKNDFFC